MPRAVAEFYAERDYSPVWDDKRYAELLTELGQLDNDGLNPDDYGYRELLRLRRANSPDTLAQREKLATYAYLLALLHLYQGKVDPVQLDAHWNFDKRPFDPEKGIAIARQAVELDRIGEIFRRVRPEFQQYEAMRAALGHLRQLAAQGGWPVIPEGPILKPGMSDSRVPVLRKRLALAGLATTQVASATLYDAPLVSAVKRFQQESFVETDGILGNASLHELNVGVGERMGQLRANLERMRWFRGELQGDFVLVDIAGYRIYYMHAGRPLWRSRVQIGKAYRQTPVFESQISAITLNPSWSVPPTILREDELPAIRRDHGYLVRHHLRVIDAAGNEVAPDEVDWQHPDNISLRQDPGPGNSLGQLLIRFPNTFSVYMHDTPHQDLFAAGQRAFSSGCIRVENVRELAVLLLNDPVNWSRTQLDTQMATNKTRTLVLNRKVPVLIAYWTVNVSSDGYVSFKPDIYHQDGRLLTALDAPPAVVDIQ